MAEDVHGEAIDRRIETLVWAQAARTPHAQAVESAAGSMTYGELVAAAEGVAARLRAQGVARGSMVGIHLERSSRMLVALLGVLRAGGIYIPLDPAFPAERLRHMIRDSRLAHVVSEAALEDVDPDAGCRRLLVEDLVEAGAGRPAKDPDPAPTGSPGDLAYVLYTSGSTGLPKGVAIEHRSVVNFLLSMQREPGIRAGDRLLAVTTLSFDISVLELFLPLCAGATVVIASRDDAMDGTALRSLVEGREITIMQATPSSWRLLIEAGWTGSAGFRALCGGEALPVDLATALGARCAELWNMYGPTETTIWSTLWRVPADCPRILVGKPIANTQVHVVDKAGRRAPPGIPGEICIGGAGVARGYLHRDELTAERFVPDPFSDVPGARLYRTGDQGRLLPDGNLECRGRLDGQVKIRGYRIETGEVEAQLLAHPALARAVVVAREDPPGDARLVAYVVMDSPTGASDAELASHLRRHLPNYMVPQQFVRMDRIPLLPNGKVDRNALPAPPAPTVSTQPSPESRSSDDPRVAYLMATWSELLGTQASPEDNFFELGGHSMLAVQMANRVSRETGHRIRVLPLATQTLRQLAVDLPLGRLEAADGRQGALAGALHRGRAVIDRLFHGSGN